MSRTKAIVGLMLSGVLLLVWVALIVVHEHVIAQATFVVVLLLILYLLYRWMRWLWRHARG